MIKIGARQLSELMGKDITTASRTMAKWASGRPVHGHLATVERVSGKRGGTGGVYQVIVETLPLHLQQRFWGKDDASKGYRIRADGSIDFELDLAALRASLSDAAKVRFNQKTKIISLLLRAEGNTADLDDHAHNIATSIGVSKTEVVRVYRKFERQGLAAFLPKPKDVSLPVISKTFDRFFKRNNGEDASTLRTIRGNLMNFLKVKASGPDFLEGRTRLSQLGKDALSQECINLNVHVDKRHLVIDKSIIDEIYEYGAVYVKNNDAKRWRDIQPRIRRCSDSLLPMEMVSADCKYVRLNMIEPGRKNKIWVGFVVFLDQATGRTFLHLVPLSSKSARISSSDVISAYCKMVTHASWGIPKTVYFDNGGEFHILADLVSLVKKAHENFGQELTVVRIFEDICAGRNGRSDLQSAGADISSTGPSSIKHAPHNPSAKPVEGEIRNLDRAVFSKISGFQGLGKKGAIVNKLGDRETPPLRQSWKDFEADVLKLNREFHLRPYRRGKSRKARFDEAVRAGFKPSLAKSDILRALIENEVPRAARKGTLSHSGRSYTADNLYNYPIEEVNVLISTKDEDNVLCRKGNKVFPLKEDKRYDFLDPQGRVESDRRKKFLDERTEEKQREIDAIRSKPLLGPVVPDEVDAEDATKSFTSRSKTNEASACQVMAAIARQQDGAQ